MPGLVQDDVSDDELEQPIQPTRKRRPPPTQTVSRTVASDRVMKVPVAEGEAQWKDTGSLDSTNIVSQPSRKRRQTLNSEGCLPNSGK